MPTERQAGTASKTLEESAYGAAAWILVRNMSYFTSKVRDVIKLSEPGSIDYTPRLIIFSLVSSGGELKNVSSTVPACLSIGINQLI